MSQQRTKEKAQTTVTSNVISEIMQILPPIMSRQLTEPNK